MYMNCNAQAYLNHCGYEEGKHCEWETKDVEERECYEDFVSGELLGGVTLVGQSIGCKCGQSNL